MAATSSADHAKHIQPGKPAMQHGSTGDAVNGTIDARSSVLAEEPGTSASRQVEWHSSTQVLDWFMGELKCRLAGSSGFRSRHAFVVACAHVSGESLALCAGIRLADRLKRHKGSSSACFLSMALSDKIAVQ
jgi:hypothetical protein